MGYREDEERQREWDEILNDPVKWEQYMKVRGSKPEIKSKPEPSIAFELLMTFVMPAIIGFFLIIFMLR
jgi:hypothetical protein